VPLKKVFRQRGDYLVADATMMLCCNCHTCWRPVVHRCWRSKC